MNSVEDFLNLFKASVDASDFVKITFSKPPKKTAELQNVYVRKIEVKEDELFAFRYKYKTNDLFKNFTFDEIDNQTKELLETSFRSVTLFTLSNDFTLLKNKKGKITILKKEPTFTNIPEIVHDHQKEKRAEKSAYLKELGIVDSNGKVIHKMADKFRQINKYLEIFESLLKQANLPKKLKVVDMGSGKGYLTFALYDFLNNKLKFDADVTGIELRKDLTDFCDKAAQKCGYENLKFISDRIENFDDSEIDILIALHACDTATDDVIYKGITSKSKMIICAPCCHKQVRKSAKINKENPVLNFGIFQERHFEMVTDTIRALVLEQNNYSTKVFEFVSNEHTRKNIMLSAVKKNDSKSIEKSRKQIDTLLSENNINHYLLDKLN